MTAENSKAKDIFFILGRARSGTTLLRSLLDQHPDVSIPPECAFVNNLFSRYFNKSISGQNARRFLKNLKGQPAYSLLYVQEETLLKTLSSSSYSFADACLEVYLHAGSLTEKGEIKHIGDKNPHYALFIPRLLRIFPDARFIHIIRDPRANVHSMMNVDFEAHCTASLAWRWKYYNKKIKKAAAKHNERFFILRYEELVSQPQEMTKKLCEFLGIDYREEMLNFYLHKDKAEKNYPIELLNRYHSQLFKPISEERVDVWKSELSPRQIRIIEAVAGGFMNEYSYTKTNTEKLFGTLILSMPGVLYGRLYMIWGDFLNILPYGIKMTIIRMMAHIFSPWWKKA